MKKWHKKDNVWFKKQFYFCTRKVLTANFSSYNKPQQLPEKIIQFCTLVLSVLRCFVGRSD